MTTARDFATFARTMRRLLSLALTSKIVACGGDGAATSFMSGPPPITGAAEQTGTTVDDTSSSAPAPDTSPGGSSTSTTSGDLVWDMGTPDFGPTKPAGCAGKIDFLFVINAQGTMLAMQKKLVAAFPSFIAAIEQQLSGFDVHVLVANPNPKPGWLLTDCSVCTSDCDPLGQPPNCGAALQPCDKEIGAGITFPAGANASNRRCELASNLRYIVSGEQDMTAEFTCIAQVGTSGASRLGEAMVTALRPGLTDPDDYLACNRGFLRDDALLVVTLIGDTYDSDSLGTVDEWIEELRAAKHGDDDAFAVLVLTTDVDLGYGQLCLPDQFTPFKNRLRLLAEGVEHGFIESICIEDFGEFFSARVSEIVSLCDEFVPPG